MSERDRRAWQFLMPRFGDEGGPIPAGPQLNPQGGIETVQGEESIRQAILLLLATAPGERVMRPDYGCGLHRLLFAPNDDSTAGLAIDYVRQAIERFESRVEIMSLDAGPSPDVPELLEILLIYRVRATQQSGQILFSINLMEGG